MRQNTLRRSFMTYLSIVAIFLIWSIAAWLKQDELLPSPFQVYDVFLEELKSGALVHHMLATLGRVAAAFFLAMVIGTLFGVLMGRYRQLDDFFDPWLILFLNIPALVIIFFAYIWGGVNDIAAVIAVALNKIPNVTVTMREGARALSKDLDEMARTYQFSLTEKLHHVILPQLQPFLAASARLGLALIWKIVLVVEMLGLSSGMGFQIHTFFSEFNVAAIMAYSIAFIMIMMVIEIFIMKPMERYATRWRSQS